MLALDRIGHVVFTVRDVEATCAWCARVLGMDVPSFAPYRRILLPYMGIGRPSPSRMLYSPMSEG